MGNTLQAWFDQFVPRNPLVGEVKAAWSAIQLVASEGYENIILEGVGMLLSHFVMQMLITIGVLKFYVMTFCIL